MKAASWRQFVSGLALAVTPEEAMAMDYLESLGLVFLAEFTVKNCEALAVQLFMLSLESRR